MDVCTVCGNEAPAYCDGCGSYTCSEHTYATNVDGTCFCPKCMEEQTAQQSQASVRSSTCMVSAMPLVLIIIAVALF